MKIKIFLLFVISLWLFVFYKTGLFKNNNHNIKVTIIKQRGNIHNLSTWVNKVYEKSINIDIVDFPINSTLKHHLYGNLGYRTNFFMDINAKFILKKDVNISFAIGSDDGFRLKIDNKTVCEHIKDRPFKYTKCSTLLEAGEHYLNIFYFQGYGPMGLKGFYAINHKRKLIGEDSRYMKFVKFDRE